MKFAYRNPSDYQMLVPGKFDLTFSDCFIVEMKLEYSETYNPVAAFNLRTYQIMVIDRNYEPLLLCVQYDTVVA